MSDANELSRRRRHGFPDIERLSTHVIVTATPGDASSRQHSAASSCHNSTPYNHEHISPLTQH